MTGVPSSILQSCRTMSHHHQSNAQPEEMLLLAPQGVRRGARRAGGRSRLLLCVSFSGFVLREELMTPITAHDGSLSRSLFLFHYSFTSTADKSTTTKPLSSSCVT